MAESGVLYAPASIAAVKDLGSPAGLFFGTKNSHLQKRWKPGARFGIKSLKIRAVQVSAEKDQVRTPEPGFFEAEAPIGKVECTGVGCRPIFEEEEEEEKEEENLPEMEPEPIPLKLPEFLLGYDSADRFFQDLISLGSHSPALLCGYADFAWKGLHNKSTAEKLYEEALAASNGDIYVMGNYAHFLWQADDT